MEFKTHTKENYFDGEMNMLISHSAIPGAHEMFNKCLLNKQIHK